MTPLFDVPIIIIKYDNRRQGLSDFPRLACTMTKSPGGKHGSSMDWNDKQT